MYYNLEVIISVLECLHIFFTCKHYLNEKPFIKIATAQKTW